MNKKKKSTNISPYPDEVIDRLARAFYPAILACWNSEEGQRSLVGARPLHLASARPFGRLKAPLGLSLLRCAAQTRACLWQAEQAHHANNEKQEVPSGGELPAVHITFVCGLNRKFYKQCNSQRPICDMQFTVVANESKRELRWQGASYSGAHPVFLIKFRHFLLAASDIRHQHGSESDVAHPGIVPAFCAGRPYKHARTQYHFPAYCPIFSA